MCGGDFNSTREGSKRMGRNLDSKIMESNEFNEFIVMVDLVDVPLIGSRFTWSNKEGSIKSRLDKFMLSEGLIDSWKIVGPKVGDMDIFDHSLIWPQKMTRIGVPNPLESTNVGSKMQNS